jgi:glycosyltransferase involved in cell wall biosynthesis
MRIAEYPRHSMLDGAVIGIDARAAAEVPAGRGRYVRELLRALARRDDGCRWLLYAREEWDEPLGERFEWRLIDSPDPLWHLRAARAANAEAAAFLSTNSYLTAWFTRIPTAVVVHDMIAFHGDARPQRRAALIERATAGLAVRRARLLIAVSEWTRSDLVRLFPRASRKTAVILEAADVPEAAAVDAAGRLGLERPFVLSVGTLEPRKNLGRLVEAWSLLPDDLRAAHTLALVGPKGWQLDEVLAPIRASGDDIRVTGFVSDEDLAALYRSCELFCYPSLYEGFGLPVLEAMQCGAAVVSSNASSLPEVGGDAVAYVDPRSAADIAATLERLLRDPAERERLAAAGRARAAGFSWDEAARLTSEALAALVNH